MDFWVEIEATWRLFLVLVANLMHLVELAWPSIVLVGQACSKMPGSFLDFCLECQWAVRQLWTVVFPPACRAAAAIQDLLTGCADLVEAVWNAAGEIFLWITFWLSAAAGKVSAYYLALSYVSVGVMCV